MNDEHYYPNELINISTNRLKQQQDIFFFLESDSGQAAKTFEVDTLGRITKKTDYSGGYLFKPQKKYIPDLQTLANILSQPLNSFMVLGRFQGAAVSEYVRRIKNIYPDDKEHGHTILADTLRKIFPIDVDGYSGTMDSLISALPEQFHGAERVQAYSSSHGIYEDDGIKVHLFFMLDCPLLIENMKTIAVNANHDIGFKLFDPAIYQPQQPLYCARPTFLD